MNTIAEPVRFQELTKKIPNSTQVVVAAFGQQPEDVISPVKIASDTLDWLDELFTTIKEEIDGQGRTWRIRRLAEMGQYLANDFAGHCDSLHEAMFGKLQDAGLISSDIKRRPELP